jgi:CO/xanthine dehydrogenase FAD-binding subunit
MIPNELRYLRPDSAEEAVAAWKAHQGARYLAGGTEISTMARRSASYPVRALIDIKRLAEARVLSATEDRLTLGAALPLSSIADDGAFPLLTATIRGIAERTTRNRLSLGGNIAGMLPYREAALPLLLADALCLSLTPGPGSEPPLRREWRLRERFDKRLLLEPGELLLSFSLPLGFTRLPWSHRRKTRTGPVDYPLATLCLARQGEAFLLGVSGAHPYPIFSAEANESLSFAAGGGSPGIRGAKPGADPSSRVRTALDALGAPKGDQRASAEYRAALLDTMLASALEELS